MPDDRPTWIRTADRMPDDGDRVLLYYRSCLIGEWYSYFGDSGNWQADGMRLDADDVTHWTPLPSPPTEATPDA